MLSVIWRTNRWKRVRRDGIVTNLVNTQERLKPFAEAEAWRWKWVKVVKASAGADSLLYAGELGALGANLLQQ